MSEKHEVLLRLKAIELLAYWEGRLVTNRLTSWFGISRQQASTDIKRYIGSYNPDALVHSPSVKAYVPQPGFTPVLTSGHINEYLNLLSTLNEQPLTVTLETEPQLAAVQLPDRSVKPEVVREIVNACRLRSSVKIQYASMSNPIWHERIISPHTLVYTGFRWHVRAYCHQRQEFRDFLLSRISRKPSLSDQPSADPLQDSLWHEYTELTLIPNPGLSAAQKSLVEQDFSMPDGRLQLRVRKALAHYTLQRYQAAVSAEEARNVMQHPLILQDTERSRLQAWLFPAKASGSSV